MHGCTVCVWGGGRLYIPAQTKPNQAKLQAHRQRGVALHRGCRCRQAWVPQHVWASPPVGGSAAVAKLWGRGLPHGSMSRGHRRAGGRRGPGEQRRRGGAGGCSMATQPCMLSLPLGHTTLALAGRAQCPLTTPIKPGAPSAACRAPHMPRTHRSYWGATPSSGGWVVAWCTLGAPAWHSRHHTGTGPFGWRRG